MERSQVVEREQRRDGRKARRREIDDSVRDPHSMDIL